MINQLSSPCDRWRGKKIKIIMETLEELREKYNNLNAERSIIYKKIVELEQQKITSKFAVGECYFNSNCDSSKKIIAIDKNTLYCVVVDDRSIFRTFYDLRCTIDWKKITPEQFENIYNAVMKDIHDPDLKNKSESNWDIAIEAVKI